MKQCRKCYQVSFIHKSILHCTFRHFVASSLSQKYINCSHFFKIQKISRKVGKVIPKTRQCLFYLKVLDKNMKLHC